jgi:putative membrane protein
MEIINFLMYVGVSLPLLVIGIFVFAKTTPYNDFKIMFDGDELEDKTKVAAAKAVAFDLGGKMIGLSMVMASAVYHAVNLVDLAIWGGIAMVSLIIIYYIFELLTPGISIRKEIPNGNMGVGIFSFSLSIASGILMAALISY